MVMMMAMMLLEIENPKGPCDHIVYTLALKYSLHGYFRERVDARWQWAPAPLGEEIEKTVLQLVVMLIHMGVSKIRGTLFGDLYNKDLMI